MVQTKPTLEFYAFFNLLHVSATHIDHYQVEKYSHGRKSAKKRPSVTNMY